MKQNNRIFKIGLLFIILLSFYGFSQKPNEDIIVKYDRFKSSTPPKWANHAYQFIFYPDYTFEYYNSFGRHSSGTWHYKDGNTIILNSHIQTRKAEMEYAIEHAGLEKTIMEVRIHAGESVNHKDYICTPFYSLWPRYYHPNRGSYEIVYTDSSINETWFNIEKMPLIWNSSSLTPPDNYTIHTGTIMEESSPGDRIIVDIYVDDSLFTYEIFSNMEIKVRKNKIVFVEPYNGTREHIYLNNIDNP